MAVEAVFTSNADGSIHRALIPREALTPVAEDFMLTHAPEREAGEVITVRVEPACMAGDDEVIAFAALEEPGNTVIGTISRNVYSLSGAVTDLWERFLVTSGRELTETASYVMRRLPDESPVDLPSGIRLMGPSPNEWRYQLAVPPVRELDFGQARLVGKSGSGVVERVFVREVFDALRQYVTVDTENECMAALHGRLWLTPNDEGKLLPYVLYEAFVPLHGDSTTHSIRIEADAQAATAGHHLGLAAIVHSHPYQPPDAEDQCQCENCRKERESEWGPVGLSATDINQFRRALPHVHQSSWVCALPREEGRPIKLVPHGYANGGRVRAESGFWVLQANYVPEPLAAGARHKELITQ